VKRENEFVVTIQGQAYRGRWTTDSVASSYGQPALQIWVDDHWQDVDPWALEVFTVDDGLWNFEWVNAYVD